MRDGDDATAAEMRRMLKAGAMVWTVGEKFGLSPAEVREACDPRRRALARREARASVESRESAARAASRAEARAAARQAAVSERKAARRAEAARARKATAGRARRAAARDEEIRRLWSGGMTGRALAARFGMAPSKVSGIVAGLPRPLRHADAEFAPRLPPLPRPEVIPPAPAGPDDLLVEERRDYAKGSGHGRARLDEAKVIEMRRLRASGWSTGRLAERYSVNRNTVCYAIVGKTWGHVAEGLNPIGGGG